VTRMVTSPPSHLSQQSEFDEIALRRVASRDYVGVCFEIFNKPWFITCTSRAWPLCSYYPTQPLKVLPFISLRLHNYQCLVSKSEGDLQALTEITITASEMVEVGPHDCHRHQVRVHQALDPETLPACPVLHVDGAENHPDAIYPMTLKMFLLMKNATPQLKSKSYSH